MTARFVCKTHACKATDAVLGVLCEPPEPKLGCSRTAPHLPTPGLNGRWADSPYSQDQDPGSTSCLGGFASGTEEPGPAGKRVVCSVGAPAPRLLAWKCGCRWPFTRLQVNYAPV